MLEYASYYIAILVQLLTIYGFWLGGGWVFMGIVSFPVFALMDSVLPADLKSRRMTSHSWANFLVWICILLAPVIYLGCAWQVGQGGLNSVEIAGAILSCAWLSVVPLVPAAHELYHQRGTVRRFVGRYVQICYLDAKREIAHVVGHHIHVATTDDGDTAKRGPVCINLPPVRLWRARWNHGGWRAMRCRSAARDDGLGGTGFMERSWRR